MEKNKLTVWQSACIITGYGVGGGIMAMPYLAEKNGILMALAILVLSFIVNLIIHLMIADISIKSGGKSQIVEVFSKYLFTGKYQKPVTLLFFVITINYHFQTSIVFCKKFCSIKTALLQAFF